MANSEWHVNPTPNFWQDANPQAIRQALNAFKTPPTAVCTGIAIDLVTNVCKSIERQHYNIISETLPIVAEFGVKFLQPEARVKLAKLLMELYSWAEIHRLCSSVSENDPAYPEAQIIINSIPSKSESWEEIYRRGLLHLQRKEINLDSLYITANLLWRLDCQDLTEELLLLADKRLHPHNRPIEILLRLYHAAENPTKIASIFSMWFATGDPLVRVQRLLELIGARHDYQEIMRQVESHLSPELTIKFYVTSSYMAHLIGFDAVSTHCATRLLDLRTQLAQKLGVDSLSLEVLSADQLGGVVGIPSIDLLVRLRQLNLVKSKLVLLVDPANFVNLSVLEQYKSHATIITDPTLRDGLKDLLSQALTRTCPYIKLDDGRVLRDEVCWAVIDTPWKAQGKGPLIKLKSDHLEFGWRNLQELTDTKIEWFVTVHLRGSKNPPKATRDVDIESYYQAFERIVRAGGHVVRIGDPQMHQLKTQPGVIDYAHSPQKCEKMDMFLFSQCRFFIGVNSGPTSAVRTFDIPSVLTNHIPLCLASPRSSDFYIIKLVWSEREQRLLTFRELLQGRLGRTVVPEIYAQHQVSLRDNTPEEILEVVDEMMEALHGEVVETAEDKERQAKLQSLYKEFGVYSNARMGRNFLRRYQNLL